MDKQQDSKAGKNRKSIKEPRSLTKRTEWACWMHGADPEWFWSERSQVLANAFPAGLPQWLLKCSPWQSPTGSAFAVVRKHMLRINVRQCAAYLGVSQAQLRRWEKGEDPLPLAAYEAIRLQSETTFARLSHSTWDGWYVDQVSGQFVSPDHGRLALTPEELNALPMTLAEVSVLRSTTEKQARRIDELEAENAALRAGQKVRAVAGELAEMHERIGDLLSELQTAAVLPFPSASNHSALRKVAS